MQATKPFILYLTLAAVIGTSQPVSANRVSKNPPSPYSAGTGTSSKNWLRGDFSGDITFVTNYISYGTSSSNNLPALQGTVSYSLPSGPYLSLWGTNAIIEGWMQSLELYPSVGWTGQKNQWSWYLLAAYDSYFVRPKDMNPSYFEVEGALSYQFSKVQLSLGITYSPNYYAIAGQTLYPFALLNIPLQDHYSIGVQAAYAFIQDNLNYGTPDYAALRLGLIKASFLDFFDAGLYLYGTSIPKSQCYPQGPGLKPLINLCGPGAFFTLSRAFG